MGRKTRNDRNGWKRRTSTTLGDASCSSLTDQPSQEYKKPRTEEVLIEHPSDDTRLSLKEDCIKVFKDDTKLSGDKQEKSVNKRTYASVSRGHTDNTNTNKCNTGKNETIIEESFADGSRCDNTSCLDFATVVTKGFNPVQTKPLKKSSCQNMKSLVTIYTIQSPTLSVPCLKCKTDDMKMSQNKEPRLIFRHEELVVTAVTVTVDEDKRSNPPLCRVFDNEFVKSRERLLEIYWKKYFEYVKNGQHKIDLHGMSELVAKAAVESVVARERQYAKDIRGNADGPCKMLEIVTGRGSHSSGAPVLPDAVIKHISTLEYTKIKQINPGLIEVDVRSSKSKLFRPISIRSD